MHAQYKDRANFLTLYIKEAHPTDEWQMTANEKEDVCYPQPRSSAQRAAIARDFVKRFGRTLPVLVDPIEDPANALYAGWPERLYIVDEQGKIVHNGGMGPFHFDPEEASKWLATRFP